LGPARGEPDCLRGWSELVRTRKDHVSDPQWSLSFSSMFVRGVPLILRHPSLVTGLTRHEREFITGTAAPRFSSRRSAVSFLRSPVRWHGQAQFPDNLGRRATIIRCVPSRTGIRTVQLTSTDISALARRGAMGVAAGRVAIGPSVLARPSVPSRPWVGS
jgi:hypothetical protein